jgi:hypothetical protein
MPRWGRQPGQAVQDDLHAQLEDLLGVLAAAEAEQAAPGFVTALRAIGVAYLVGNAVGLLALTGRTWVSSSCSW